MTDEEDDELASAVPDAGWTGYDSGDGWPGGVDEVFLGEESRSFAADERELRELERRVESDRTPAFPIDARRSLPLKFLWTRWQKLAMRGRSDVVDDFGRDPRATARWEPLLELLYSRWFRVETRGLENIPKQSCVVLSKHQSAWETLALQTVLPPHCWVAKRELLWIPFFGWLLALSSPIALDRSKGKESMRQLLEKGKSKLQQGFSVVLFPEGTRIPFGQRGKYKIGGALLAEHSGVQVMPVAHNAGKFWGRNSFIKYPGTVVMSIGKPIDTSGLKADEINRQTEDWIEGEMTKLG